MTVLVTAVVNGIGMTLPAGLGSVTIGRVTDETEAEYQEAAAMYRKLFRAALAEARRRSGER